jgi:hypothetical protein
MHASPHQAAPVRAFLMLNADIRAPGIAPEGHYDPETQSWIGESTPLSAGTSSSRSNGSRGGYSYQSDD